MRITPEMLLDALHAGARPGVWLQDRFDSSDEAILIDGWFDLAKAAELLNTELLRQAQTSESVGMLNINVTAWEET
jgi:hypothetical protein